jgi:hypothetical protein
MTAIAPLTTEHVFDYRVALKPPVFIGRGPFGTRVFYEVVEGRAEGPRLNGDILTGGGDWAIVDDHRWTRLDVRGQVRTDDGAVLMLKYEGVIEPTERLLQAVSAGEGVEFGDQYFRASITVETGDERYAWLTRSVLVARGRLLAGPGVEYQVFRVD